MKSPSSAALEPEATSVVELRRQARRRAWVCPGAGFELLGFRGAAALTFWSGLGTMAAAVWTAWSPSRGAFWLTVALFAVSSFTWLLELWATYVAWPKTTAPPAGRRYRFGGALILMLTVVLILIVMTTYAVIRIEDDGMSPTIRPNEQLLYREGVNLPQLERGRLVLFHLSSESKYGEEGLMVIARILAVPGDQLSMRNGMYYVNDVAESQIATAGESLISLEIARHPQHTTVPKGCYFVVQDSPEGGHDSRIFSWAHRENMLSTQFWSLSRFPSLPTIE